MARAALRTSGWSRLRPNDRAQVLYRFADAVLANAEYLAQLEALTSCRLYSLTSTVDAMRTAGAIRYNAEYCDKLEGVITPTGADAVSLIRNEPYGIVGAIVPWNFPLLTSVWKVGPALAAGNAIIVKTSELTPHSLLALAQIAVQAGLPPGLFSVISGRGHTTRQRYHPPSGYREDLLYRLVSDRRAYHGAGGGKRHEAGDSRTGRQESSVGVRRRHQPRRDGDQGVERALGECRSGLHRGARG